MDRLLYPLSVPSGSELGRGRRLYFIRGAIPLHFRVLWVLPTQGGHAALSLSALDEGCSPAVRKSCLVNWKREIIWWQMFGAVRAPNIRMLLWVVGRVQKEHRGGAEGLCRSKYGTLTRKGAHRNVSAEPLLELGCPGYTTPQRHAGVHIPWCSCHFLMLSKSKDLKVSFEAGALSAIWPY